MKSPCTPGRPCSCQVLEGFFLRECQGSVHTQLPTTLAFLEPSSSCFPESYIPGSLHVPPECFLELSHPCIIYIITMLVGHRLISPNFHTLQPNPSCPLYLVDTIPHYILNHCFYFVPLPGDVSVTLFSQSMLGTCFQVSLDTVQVFCAV